MEHIIIYGSQYGSSRRYAEKLSEQTGIPAVSYKDAPDLSGRSVVVYLGSLYAGGVLGLSKTLRGLSLIHICWEVSVWEEFGEELLSGSS